MGLSPVTSLYHLYSCWKERTVSLELCPAELSFKNQREIKTRIWINKGWVSSSPDTHAKGTLKDAYQEAREVTAGQFSMQEGSVRK